MKLEFPKLKAIYQILIGTLFGIIVSQFNFGAILIIIVIIFLLYFQKLNFIILIIFTIAGGLYVLFLNSIFTSEVKFLTHENREITLVGSVVEDPISKDFYQEVVIQPRDFNIYVLCQFDKYLNINAGDIITFKSTPALPEQSDYFDRVGYLKSRRIFLESKNSKIIKSESYSSNIFTFLGKIKTTLSQILDRNLKEPQTTLAKGLIIGDDSNLSDDLKQNLKNSGLSHITSVSGYNVGLIFIGALYLSKIFSRKLALICGIIIVIFFWLLVGFNNLPTERATIMLSFVTLALICGRKMGYFYAILLSTLVILIEYPGYLFNISFQLSLAAMLALLILAPKMLKILTKMKIKNMFTEIVATSIAIILITLPISFLTFGQVSSVSIISNILVLPLVPIATILIIIAIFCSLIGFNLLSDPLFLVLNYLLKFIIFIINQMGSLSFASITNPILVLIFFLALLFPVLFLTIKYKDA